MGIIEDEERWAKDGSGLLAQKYVITFTCFSND